MAAGLGPRFGVMKAVIFSLSLLLFLLVYITIRGFLAYGEDSFSRKRRLRAKREERDLKGRFPSRLRPLIDHAEDLLTASGWSIPPSLFITMTATMGLAGGLGGFILFQSVRSALLLSGVLLCLPYSLLRMKLMNRQLSARLHFLPAMEMFYQCYLVSGSRQIRTALQKMVEERQLPGEVQAIFEQLYRQLCVQGDPERSLRRFAMAIGHVWADYFGNMLRVALAEGNNIGDNLRELIDDMRRARMDDQSERHRMLEIRLANFSPILFLALFLIVNFRLNPEGSYQYYVLDPTGRRMLLYAMVLMFASFLMGLYLSRRKL